MPQCRRDSTFDDAVRAFVHRDRRRLLIALLEHNPQEEVPVPEGVQVDERALDDLHADMYHTHLPKLDALGFIEWDQEAHTVNKGPNFAEIRPMLELLDEHRDDLPDGWV